MELLTIAQIAKQLDLPESTVRYYRDRFSEYIPTTGEGRGRRYKGEAVEVFRFIADKLRAGMPADILEVELRSRFAREVTAGPQSDHSSSTAAMVPAAAFMEVLARIDGALGTLGELPRLVEEQSRDIERLRRRLDDLSTAATAAATQQQLAEARDRELLSTVTELRKNLETRVTSTPWRKRILGLSPAA